MADEISLLTIVGAVSIYVSRLPTTFGVRSGMREWLANDIPFTMCVPQAKIQGKYLDVGGRNVTNMPNEK